MNFKSAYDSHDEASLETGFAGEGESMTQQNFVEECDINTIVRRFGVTGELPSDVRMPQSGDFTGITDFHSAMNSVRAAEESFAAMPPDVRSRFHNDAGLFVDFCMDDKNYDEAVKLGLVRAGAVEARRASGSAGATAGGAGAAGPAVGAPKGASGTSVT